MTTLEQRLEKFGVADENGEITIDRQAELKDFVQRGVTVLKEIDVLKEDYKELVEEADGMEYDKAELKALIKHAHKNAIDIEIEKLESLRTKLDDLFGEDN